MNDPVDYSALEEKNIRPYNGKVDGLDKLSFLAGPIVVGFFGIFICWTVYPLALILGNAILSAAGVFYQIFFTIVLTIVLICAHIWVVWLIIFTRKSTEAVLRFALFATRNNLHFFYGRSQLSIPGLIRESRRSTLSSMQLSGSYNGKSFEYQNSYTMRQSYNLMSVRLLRADTLKKHVELPHILFNCKTNDKFFIANLPKYFTKSDEISLDGDMNKKYTLYSKADPITTLSLISPDVMAIIQDYAHNVDVELYMDRVTIVTNWGYPDKQNIETCLKLVDAIRPKIERYFQNQSSLIS